MNGRFKPLEKESPAQVEKELFLISILEIQCVPLNKIRRTKAPISYTVL